MKILTRKMITDFKKISLLCFFIFISSAMAQTKTSVDTLRAFQLSIPQEVLEYQLNNTDYLSDFSKMLFKKSMLNDSSSAWMRARMMIDQFSKNDEMLDNSASKMINPMYNDYIESQKLATLKAILGSVQVGAVAYLAYKHLKKYGFLKK